MPSEHTPTVLSIAGFDPYGGAGIVADVKTIHALGGYAFTAITANTVQNSQGVQESAAVDADYVHRQLCALFDDVHVDAVKIGMLANREIIEAVADVLKTYQAENVVLDPVLVSSSGYPLLDDEAVEQMVMKLFPLCRLVTPNLDETNRLLGSHYTGSAKEVPRMAEALFGLGARNMLLKGGHTTEEDAVDSLFELSSITRFSTPRVNTVHTHGTGCVLSSAIATQLALGESLAQSVKHAKQFLYEKLLASESLHLSYRECVSMRKEPIF